MSKHNPLIRRTIGMLAAAALISGTMSALHGALPRSQAAPVLATETPAQTAAPVAREKDLETDRTAERRGGVIDRVGDLLGPLLRTSRHPSPPRTA